MNLNRLCPQHYCEMVLEYLVGFRTIFPFTVDKISKFCIKRTEVLDDGDDEKIRHIVELTLKTLCQHGYIVKHGQCYTIVTTKDIRDFEGVIMEEPKTMVRFTKEMFDRINEINERTRYNDFVL